MQVNVLTGGDGANKSKPYRFTRHSPLLIWFESPAH
jgi:hypothetical protein